MNIKNGLPVCGINAQKAALTLGGVSEMRIHYGLGYRVYYKDTGKIIYVLLCGGDKSTQSKDIVRAKELARNLEDIV